MQSIYCPNLRSEFPFQVAEWQRSYFVPEWIENVMVKEFKLSKEGNSRITDKNWKEEMYEFAKNIAQCGFHLLFDEHLQKIYPETVQRFRQTFWRKFTRWWSCWKLRKIFWVYNKTIIEFDFRMIWRIMQILEAVIHTTSSEMCIIRHIKIGLIQ